MNYIKLFALIFSALFLVTCKNKKPDPVKDSYPYPKGCEIAETVFVLDKSLMQQFLFKAGTYWIYKDSVTNTIDSCFCYGPKVVSDNHTFARCNFISAYAFDSINLLSVFQYTYYLHSKYINLFAPTGRHNGVLLGTLQAGKLSGDSLSQYYSSITINTVLYSDVHKLHFKAPNKEFKEGCFYMKPGVGIIKSEFYTKEVPAVRKVYELVRYHIET